MAALALTFAACSNDDNDIAQPRKAKGITITAQLAPKTGGADTRAVSEGSDSKTYTASKASTTFAAGKYYQSNIKLALPPITMTWNSNSISGSGNSFSKYGVTITAASSGYIDWDDKYFEYGGTFTTTLGNFTKIEVTSGDYYEFGGTGWSASGNKRTWTGTPASSVSFDGCIEPDGTLTIVFTIQPN